MSSICANFVCVDKENNINSTNLQRYSIQSRSSNARNSQPLQKRLSSVRDSQPLQNHLSNIAESQCSLANQLGKEAYECSRKSIATNSSVSEYLLIFSEPF